MSDILTKCSSHLDDGLEHSVKTWAKVSEFKLVTDNPFMKDEGIEGRLVTTIDCLCMRIIFLFLDLGFHAS